MGHTCTGNSVFYRLFYETAFGANGYLRFPKIRRMLRATLIPIITPSYTANPWSTIFMNEPNLDVACGGGVNSLWVVVLMKSALSFIWLFTSALRVRIYCKTSSV